MLTKPEHELVDFDQKPTNYELGYGKTPNKGNKIGLLHSISMEMIKSRGSFDSVFQRMLKRKTEIFHYDFIAFLENY